MDRRNVVKGLAGTIGAAALTPVAALAQQTAATGTPLSVIKQPASAVGAPRAAQHLP